MRTAPNGKLAFAVEIKDESGEVVAIAERTLHVRRKA
jgi:hypothetical protein